MSDWPWRRTMFVEHPLDGGGVELTLRPNRALSARGLVGSYLLLAGCSLAVAASSFVQGNVFAPLFALAELAVLALCLWLVWRAGEREERIAIQPGMVEIRRLPGGQRFQCHPFWARISWFPEGRGGARLAIGSHGRFAEVGTFLGVEERDRLAQRLRELLQAFRSRTLPD